MAHNSRPRALSFSGSSAEQTTQLTEGPSQEHPVTSPSAGYQLHQAMMYQPQPVYPLPRSFSGSSAEQTTQLTEGPSQERLVSPLPRSFFGSFDEQTTQLHQAMMYQPQPVYPLPHSFSGSSAEQTTQLTEGPSHSFFGGSAEQTTQLTEGPSQEHPVTSPFASYQLHQAMMHQPQDVGPRFGNFDYVHPRSPMVSHSRSPDFEKADNADFEPLMKSPTVSYKYDFQFGDTDDEIRTFLRDNESASNADNGTDMQADDSHNSQADDSHNSQADDGDADAQTHDWRDLNLQDLDFENAPDVSSQPDDTIPDNDSQTNSWGDDDQTGYWGNDNNTGDCATGKREVVYTHDIDLEHIWDPAKGNSSIPNFRHVPIDKSSVAEDSSSQKPVDELLADAKGNSQPVAPLEESKEPTALPTAEASTDGLPADSFGNSQPAAPLEKSKEPTTLPTAEASTVGALDAEIGRLVSKPNPTDLKSMAVRCLVGTPEKVRGYNGTARTAMDRRMNPAMTTRLRFIRSQTFPARVEMSHAYTHHGITFVFARFNVSLEELESRPEIAVLKADDAQLKKTLGDMDSDDLPPCLSMTFEVIPQCKPWRQVADLPDHPGPAGRLTEWLDNVMDSRKFIVILPQDQMVVSKYINVIRQEWDDYKANPTQLFARANAWFQNPSNVKQLGWKTLSVGNERFRYPEPAMSTFPDDRVRMLMTQGSSYEELELELSNSVELAKGTFKMLMLPDKSSEWTDEDSGIKPDNSTQRYLGVISDMTDEQRKYMFDIGTRSTVIIKEIDTFTARDHPAGSDNNHPVERRAIRYIIQEAQRIWDSTDIDSELDENQTREERKEQLTAVIESTFPDKLPEECRRDLPKETSNDDAKILAASMLIKQFLPPRTHAVNWENEALESMLPYQIQPPVDNSPREWNAVRVKPPFDCDTTAVYLILYVPKEKFWPPQFAAPPVKIDNLVTPDMRVGSLSRIISLAGDDFNRTATLKFTPSDVTTKREMMAVSTMATAPDATIQGRIWKYTRSFDNTDAQKVDLTKVFPQVKNMEVLPHQESLRDQLKDVPAGLFLYRGGPGSGKSTVGVKFAKAVLAKPGAKVVWGAYSNELCKDAVSKLRTAVANNDRIVVRVHPIRTTTKALTGRSDPDKAAKLTLRDDLSPGDTAVQNVMHRFQEESDRDHPMNDATSIVRLAMTIAERDPEEWEVFLRLRGRNDLAKDDIEGLNKETFRLLAFALSQVSVIVGTPVALSDFAKASQLEQHDSGRWNPDAVFIDELGRMAEAQVYACFCWSDPKIVMGTGDTKQFSPMSLSLANHKPKQLAPQTANPFEDETSPDQEDDAWHSTFGLQRRKSILDRAAYVGAIKIVLVDNQRNNGSIAVWPARHIYNGHMDVKLRNSDLGKEFRKNIAYILRLKKSRANSFIVNVSEGEEAKVSTSIANSANRNYVIYLIFRLFAQGFPSCFNTDRQGTLMVITPYAAQLGEYLRDWDKTNANDSMREKVTFKTVDDAMSAEADVVIYDTVRTDKMGFIPNEERMAVATTRARGANIVILRKDDWAKKNIADSGKVNLMVSYYNWHVEQDAVTDTRAGKTGWQIVCERCNGPDHFEYACKRTDIKPCRLCHRKDRVHHPRFCTRPFATSDSYVSLDKREADRKAAEKEEAEKDAKKAEKDAEKAEKDTKKAATTIAPAAIKIKAGVPRSRAAIRNQAIDEEVAVVANNHATSNIDRARLTNAQTALRNLNPNHGHLKVPEFAASGVLAPAGEILGTSLESDPGPEDDSDNSDNDSQAEDLAAQGW